MDQLINLEQEVTQEDNSFNEESSVDHASEPKGSEQFQKTINTKGNAMFDKLKTTEELLNQQEKYVASLGGERKKLQIIQPETFLDSMRDYGYKGLSEALGDLVDNSIEALSSEIHIVPQIDSPGKGKKKTVVSLAIIDNGTGMYKDMLVPALSFGGTDRHGGNGLFGRYGFGLPAASIYISESVRVFSKTRDMDDWYVAELDLDKVRKGMLTNPDSGVAEFREPELVTEGLPEYVRNYLAEKGLELQHGTVVCLKPDRLAAGYKQPQNFIDKVLRYVGQTYRNFLDTVDIYVDGKITKPIDPLFLTPGAENYDIGSGVNATVRPFNDIEMKNSKGQVGKMRFRISYLDPEGFGSKYSDEKQQQERFKVVRDSNSFICVNRAGREIDRITTPQFKKKMNSLVNNDRFWAVELDFDPVLDEYFGVTTSKQQISIAVNIWDKLESERLDSVIKGLRKEVKAKLTELRADETETETAYAKKQSEEVASEVATFQRPRVVDPEKFQLEADQKLELEAKKRSKKEKRKVEEIIQELNEETKQKRFKFAEEAIEGGPFYRVLMFGQQLQVLINNKHRFYTDFYLNLDAHGKTCLQMFLFALGDAEGFGSDSVKEFYESERPRWSGYLHTAFSKFENMTLERGTHASELDSEDIAESIQEDVSTEADAA